VTVLVEAWFPITVSAHVALVKVNTSEIAAGGKGGGTNGHSGSVDRIDCIAEDDLVADADAYTKGYTHLHTERVPPGVYVLVLSTYRAR
jgi:hypothetical protein